MICNSPSKNLICFKLHPILKTEFVITYKDEDELYRLFVEKLKELGIPRETVYELDYDGTHVQIDSAETLSDFAHRSGEVRLFVRDTNEYVNSFTDSDGLSPRDPLRRERASERRRSGCDTMHGCHRKHRSSAGGFICPHKRDSGSIMGCRCFCHQRHSGCDAFYFDPYYGPFQGPSCFTSPYLYM